MHVFKDKPDERRFEQDFTDPDGEIRAVWADYAVHDDKRAILHVEADERLRGTGAAGQFMQSLANHARAGKLKLIPRCSYAVAWFKRHREYADLLD